MVVARRYFGRLLERVGLGNLGVVFEVRGRRLERVGLLDGLGLLDGVRFGDLRQALTLPQIAVA